MIAFLNILILLLGTASTAAAFGGKTWNEGSQPIFERITVRGWISVACLALAFALGSTKEVTSRNQDLRKEAKAALVAAQAKTEADARQAALTAQLNTAQKASELANQQLKDLTRIDKANEDRLVDTRTALSDVRQTLTIARDDLTLQSAANLATTLVGGNRFVREILLIIPLTRSASPVENFRKALLPQFSNKTCRDLTGIEIEAPTSFTDSETDYFAEDDGLASHHFFDEKIPKTDEIKADFSQNDRSSTDDLLTNLGQKTTNHVTISVGFFTHSQKVPAAELYSGITAPHSEIASITATWPTKFRTKNDLVKAANKYPSLFDLAHSTVLSNSNIEFPLAKMHPYPQECARQLKSYLASSFDRMAMLLILDGEQREEISFRLKALEPTKTNDGTWRVPFVLANTPFIRAATPDDAAELFDDLPQSKKN